MQSLASPLARSAAPRRALHVCKRLSSHRLPATARALSTLPTPDSPPTPWFVDPSDEPFSRRQAPPHLPSRTAERPSLPPSAPAPIRALHAALANSPHLEPAALLVTEPLPTPPGPPLPDAMPKGRRRRGRTYVGEGVMEPTGIWSWIVIAQVKEGTEKRGAIESVVRLVRKTLLACNPPLPLPLNSRKTIHDGWAMVDAGDFAVHVLSGEAREKFFSNRFLARKPDMSLNDHALGPNKGVDMHPGVANPTASNTHANPLASNFVTDPTSEEHGAGAGPEFDGHNQARRTFRETAGVVEGRPGIIESTHIDPLAEDSNKDDGWANATRTPGGGGSAGVSGMVSGAGSAAGGAAKYGYGAVVGDEGAKQAGREAVSGK